MELNRCGMDKLKCDLSTFGILTGSQSAVVHLACLLFDELEEEEEERGECEDRRKRRRREGSEGGKKKTIILDKKK